MRKILFVMLAGGGGLLWAQTNLPAQKAPAAPTLINSDSADFDMAARRVEYLGHVVLTDPQVNLRCDRLVVDLPETGQHPSRISAESAETNVVIDLVQEGKMYHVTATNVLYTYSVTNSVTNDLITLTGSPVAQSGADVIRGDKMIWDRGNGHMHVYNQHGTMQVPQDGKQGTNNVPLKLF
jgi:lipopolysaccharide transport protein LptA